MSAPVLDEPTMKFGLLMESAQAHQKLAERHLENLRAHTQDLDGVVREEIRRTLVEELPSDQESSRAVQALNGMKRAAQHRGLVLSAATAPLSATLPIAVARWVLPSPPRSRPRAPAAMSSRRASLGWTDGVASSGGTAASGPGCAFVSTARTVLRRQRRLLRG